MCLSFSCASNYLFADPIKPPINHTWDEARPGGSIRTFEEKPWELLRALMPDHPSLCMERLDIYCDFGDFRKAVEDGDYEEEMNLLGREPFALQDLGFHVAPPHSFTYAWAMIIRVHYAQQAHDKVLNDPGVALLLQRFIDTHLILGSVILMDGAGSDKDLEQHPNFMRAFPHWNRGAYWGCLPNVSHLFYVMDIFHDTRMSNRTPLGAFVHFLSKQWMHPCVVRGFEKITKRVIKGTEQTMYLIMDIFLVYGILGNYVGSWDEVPVTPWRPKFWPRVPMVRSFLEVAWRGHADIDKFFGKLSICFRFATRMFAIDQMRAMPPLLSIMSQVYSYNTLGRESNYALNTMRKNMDTCDWHALDGKCGDDAMLQAAQDMEVVYRASRQEVSLVHKMMLPHLIKLRKGTFSEIMAKKLTQTLQVIEKERADAVEEIEATMAKNEEDLKSLEQAMKTRKKKERAEAKAKYAEALDLKERLPASLEHAKRRVVPILPYPNEDGVMQEPFLDEDTAAAIEHVATYIAPRSDGYFPIEWFKVLGVNHQAFAQLRDTYGGYEANQADHPLLGFYRSYFYRWPRDVVIMQRLFARVEELRSSVLVATSQQVAQAQACALAQRYRLPPGSTLTEKMGNCYYCPCGRVLSVVVSPAHNPKNLHAMGIDRGGFNPLTGWLMCKRGRSPACSQPAKKINLIGRMWRAPNKKWYTLCTVRGCGMITVIDPEFTQTTGPTCGMHGAAVPRMMQTTGWPSARVLTQRGGAQLGRLMQDHTPPPPNQSYAMPCAFCGSRPRRTGGGYVPVMDLQHKPAFHYIYLCSSDYYAWGRTPNNLFEKEALFDYLRAFEEFRGNPNRAWAVQNKRF